MSVYVNGSSFITSAYNAAFSSMSAFTIVAKLKNNSAPTYAGVLTRYLAGQVTPMDIVISHASGGGLYCYNFRVSTTGTTGAVAYGTATLGSTETQQIAAVYDGAHAILYTNGVVQSRSDAVTGTTINNTYGWTFGKIVGYATQYIGWLDYFYFYNRALSSNEVITIHNTHGLSRPVNGSLMLLNLNEASVGTVVNVAGQIKDKSYLKLDATGTSSPTYAAAMGSTRLRR